MTHTKYSKRKSRVGGLILYCWIVVGHGSEVFPSRYETRFGATRVPFYHDDHHRHFVTMCLWTIYANLWNIFCYTTIRRLPPGTHTSSEARQCGYPAARNTINLKQKRVENTLSKLINSDPYNKSIHHMCTIYIYDENGTKSSYIYTTVYITHITIPIYTNLSFIKSEWTK